MNTEILHEANEARHDQTIPSGGRKYTLTPHALERLAERTSISPENIHDLMERAIDMPYALHGDRAVKMFWSVPDAHAYLAFYNRFTREVVTIFEAYKWVNGVFKGKVYLHRNLFGKLASGDAWKVRRRDVLYCLCRAGVTPPQEFLPERPPITTERVHKNEHEIMARFGFFEGSPYVGKVMHTSEDVPIESVPLHDILAHLERLMDRRGIDPDEVKSVILEIRGKGSVEDVLQEIEIDQVNLKRMFNEYQHQKQQNGAVMV